jgi:phosphotriesterase-related protein
MSTDCATRRAVPWGFGAYIRGDAETRGMVREEQAECVAASSARCAVARPARCTAHSVTVVAGHLVYWYEPLADEARDSGRSRSSTPRTHRFTEPPAPYVSAVTPEGLLIVGLEVEPANAPRRTSTASRPRGGRSPGRKRSGPRPSPDTIRPMSRNVQGPVEASDLGTTLVHEHVRFRDEAVAENWPGATYDEAEMAAAVEAVTAARTAVCARSSIPPRCSAGAACGSCARSPSATGVRIVACTGIYTYDYLPHAFENRGRRPDRRVLRRGHRCAAARAPDIKAAFLKCAADAPGVTEHIEEVHRACARASLQTGAPIRPTRCRPSAPAEAGRRVPRRRASRPRRSRSPTAATAGRRVRAGAHRPGRLRRLDRYGSTCTAHGPAQRGDRGAAARGHAERLFISQDFCATIDWFPPEVIEQLEQSPAIHNWSMTLVFDEVVPGCVSRAFSTTPPTRRSSRRTQRAGAGADRQRPSPASGADVRE